MNQIVIPFSVFERRLATKPAWQAARLGGISVIIFLCAHVALGLLLKRVPILVPLHAGLVFLVGVWCAFVWGRTARVACVAAYIVGAEVLWRMCSITGPVPYEFGKYAVAAIFGIAIVRSGRLSFPLAPLAYFLLLLPSAGLTLFESDLATARDSISFNLSGPFSLMMSVIFFWKLPISRSQLFKILMAPIGPIAGIAVICYSSTFGASSINFGRSSNIAAAGGFGPNQVAAILGFGILLSFLCLVEPKARRGLQVVLLGAMIIFGMQSALTFSRTGLYLGIISVVLASFYLVRNPRLLVQVLLLSVVTFGVISYVVLPRLESFTGGALSDRFKTVHTTGRSEIMKADLKIWAENPILGIGVGQAKMARARFHEKHQAHTEFTRLLAEHGLFGCLAFVALLMIPVSAYSRVKSLRGKAVVVSMVGFGFLFMMASGMRLVLPAFTLGIATAALLPELGLKKVKPLETDSQPSSI